VGDLQERFLDNPALAKSLANTIQSMREAAEVRAAALRAQTDVGERMGEEAGREVTRIEGSTAILPDRVGPRSGKVDGVSWSADKATLFINEYKGPSASRSTRQVTQADGTVAAAEQGSTEHLADTLKHDMEFLDAIKGNPELCEGLKNGRITIEYRVIRVTQTGKVNVTTYEIDATQLNLIDLLG
jgi:hypothetical protein